MDFFADEFAEACSGWAKSEFWFGAFSFGAAEVAHEDQLATSVQNGFDGWDCHSDPSIVGDSP